MVILMSIFIVFIVVVLVIVYAASNKNDRATTSITSTTTISNTSAKNRTEFVSPNKGLNNMASMIDLMSEQTKLLKNKNDMDRSLIENMKRAKNVTIQEHEDETYIDVFMKQLNQKNDLLLNYLINVLDKFSIDTLNNDIKDINKKINDPSFKIQNIKNNNNQQLDTLSKIQDTETKFIVEKLKKKLEFLNSELNKLLQQYSQIIIKQVTKDGYDNTSQLKDLKERLNNLPKTASTQTEIQNLSTLVDKCINTIDEMKSNAATQVFTNQTTKSDGNNEDESSSDKLLQELRGKKAVLVVENSELNKRITELETMLKQADKKNAEIQEQINGLIQSITTYEEEPLSLFEMKDRFAQFVRIIKSLEDAKRKLEDTNVQKNVQIKDLNVKIREVQTDYNNLKQKMKTYIATNNIGQQIKQLDKVNAVEVTNNVTPQQQNMYDQYNNNDFNDILQQKHDYYKGQIATLQDKINRINTEKIQLEEQHKISLENQHQYIIKTIHEIASQNKVELSEKNATISNLNNEITQSMNTPGRSINEQQLKSVKVLKKEIESIKTKYNKNVAELKSEFETKKNAYETELETIKLQLKNTNEEYNKILLKNQLFESNPEESEVFKQKIDRITQIYDDDTKKLQTQLRENNMEIAKIKGKLEFYKNESNKNKTEIAELKNTISLQKKQLKEYSLSISNLQKENAELKGAMEMQKNELNIKIKENEQLKIELDIRNAHIEELNKSIPLIGNIHDKLKEFSKEDMNIAIEKLQELYNKTNIIVTKDNNLEQTIPNMNNSEVLRNIAKETKEFNASLMQLQSEILAYLSKHKQKVNAFNYLQNRLESLAQFEDFSKKPQEEQIKIINEIVTSFGKENIQMVLNVKDSTSPAELKSLQEQLNKLTKTNENLLTQLAKAQLQEATKEQASQLEKKIEQLQGQLKEAQTQAKKQLEEAKNTAQVQLQEAAEAKQKQLQEVQAEVSKLEEAKRTTQEQLDAANKQLKEAQADAEVQQKQLQEATKEQAAQAEAQLQETQQQLEAATAQLQLAQAEAEVKSNSHIADLNKRIDNLKDSLLYSIARNLHFVEQNKNVNSELSQLKSSYKLLQQNIQTKESEIESLKTQNDELQKRNAELNETITNYPNIFSGVNVKTVNNKQFNPTTSITQLNNIFVYFAEKFGYTNLESFTSTYQSISVRDINTGVINNWKEKHKSLLLEGLIENNNIKIEIDNNKIFAILYPNYIGEKKINNPKTCNQSDFDKDFVKLFSVYLSPNVDSFEFEISDDKVDNAFIEMYVKRNLFDYSITYLEYKDQIINHEYVFKTNIEYYVKHLQYNFMKNENKNKNPESNFSGGKMYTRSEDDTIIYNTHMNEISIIYLIKSIRYMYYLNYHKNKSTQLEDYSYTLMVVVLLYSMNQINMFLYLTIDLIFSSISYELTKDMKTLLVPYFVPFLFV